jgi:2-phospho-L-lactate guanylyltransferase (CobY/MobA/RfbA family)
LYECHRFIVTAIGTTLYADPQPTDSHLLMSDLPALAIATIWAILDDTLDDDTVNPVGLAFFGLSL